MKRLRGFESKHTVLSLTQELPEGFKNSENESYCYLFLLCLGQQDFVYIFHKEQYAIKSIPD